MARIKTFRILPDIYGVPNRDIEEFINECEQKEIVNVHSIYVPAMGEGADKIDPRIVVIVTKLDDAK